LIGTKIKEESTPTPFTGQQQRGVALITVLFILALLTTLAVYLVADENLLLRRVENGRDVEQAYQMVHGSEQWGAGVLRRDLRDTKTDHLGESWSTLASQVSVEQGTLGTRIRDEQGLFNLNNLLSGKDTVWYPAFQRLLQVLELDPGLADSVVDWLDADQSITGVNGAEDSTYLAMDVPYRAANNRFADPSELAWVAGFDEEAIALLMPYLTALPESNSLININTCSLVLMRILAAQPLAESAAQALIDGRGDAGYTGTEVFLQQTELAGQAKVTEKMITVSSRYFTVTSNATSGRANLSVNSLLQRNGEGETAEIVLLQRARTSL